MEKYAPEPTAAIIDSRPKKPKSIPPIETKELTNKKSFDLLKKEESNDSEVRIKKNSTNGGINFNIQETEPQQDQRSELANRIQRNLETDGNIAVRDGPRILETEQITG